MLLMNIDDQRLELLHPRLKDTITQLHHSVDSIPAARKEVLDAFAKLIPAKSNSETNLIFVCTHNSRRSHATMLWAQLAAYLVGRIDIRTYSGGTEVTAFNYRAIAALERAGFSASVAEGKNPPVEIGFGNTLPKFSCFSKRYDHPDNPQRDYIAMMTCADADQNCPHLPAAKHRFALRYTDPGYADGTAQEDAAYDTLVQEVGREMLYVFGSCR